MDYFGIWVEDEDSIGWLTNSDYIVFSTPSLAVAKAQLEICELHGGSEQTFVLKRFSDERHYPTPSNNEYN